MKKFLFLCLLSFGAASKAQTGQLIDPADSIADIFEIPLSEYMKAYDAYFDSLEVRGVDLDSSKEYKHYQRTIESFRYANDFPNFTFKQYADDYQDWISANNGINSCVINSQFPYLSFEEVGPTNHVNSSDGGYYGGTGQIHFINWNPFNTNEMYVCSNYGGLFKSTDAGQNWYQAGTDKKIPSTSVSSVALSPLDLSNTWYVSTGNGEFLESGLIFPATGVWRTSNGGASYQLISVPDHTMQQLNANPSLLTPNDEVYYSDRTRKVIALQNGIHVRLILASINGLFQCTDANALSPEWSKIADGQFYDVEVNPSNPNIIYASGDFDTPLIKYNLLVPGSVQVLQTFSNVKRRVSLEFCQFIDDFMYVMITESPANISKLYRYDFSTSSLTLKAILPADSGPAVGYERAMAWAVSPTLVNDKVKIVWGNVWKIKSLDDDLSNTVLTNPDFTTIMNGEIHADQHFMRFNQSSTTLYVGNDGGLFKKDMTSPLSNWENMNNGLAVGTAYKVSTSQNGDRKLMSSYQDMGNHLQTPPINSTSPWTEYYVLAGDGTEDFIHNINSDKMWCSANNTGKYTLDNWDNSDDASIPNPAFFKNFEGDVQNNDINYAASFSGMHKRDNFTGSWYQHQNLPIESNLTPANGYEYPQNVFNVFIPENPLYGDYVYVYWRGGIDGRDDSNPPIVNPRIYRSKVGGGLNPEDWELVYQFETVSFGHVAISYDDPDVFWVSEGGKIYKVDLHQGIEGVLYGELEQGLEYADVRDLIYVKGTNDGLYAATKRGLYYRDNDNYPDGWIKTCAGLPNTPIYDLEIDYCRNKIIVATYGRGIWESDIDLSTSTKPYTVSSNQTIDIEFYPGTSIIVESGATLTVTGTLYMPIGSKIIVKPNARLVVDGGTITNGCGSLWNGIEVWGNKAQSQFDVSGVNAQGEVFIKNHSVIEHAEVAVRLIKPGDWNSTGGFIRVYSSTFRNNKKDIEFGPYSNDYNGNHYANKSSFTNVLFTWDADFRRDVPLGHVTMWKVDGISFYGCIFNDVRIAGTYTASTNCVGIRSIDSKYRVMGRCGLIGCTGEIGDGTTNWVPTIFENLYFGIYASNATNLYTINVDRCQFIDNGYGVQLVSVPSPVIIRSQFKFTSDPNHFATTSAMYGIHAVNSKGLKIEENNFLDMAPGTHGAGTLGIVSSDLGEQNEENRMNTFTNMTYANYSQGKNRSSSIVNTGLQFPCNENYNNLQDHRVVGTLWSGAQNPLYGVKRYTGAPNNPVGTVFTLNGLPNEDYLSSSDNVITYYYQSTLAPIQSNIDMVPTFFFPDCPSTLINFPGGISKLPPSIKSGYISDFNSTSTLLTEKENEYLDLSLDQNEISYILGQIDNLAPNNKQSVRDMLNSYSPYLTTEILFAVADNAPSDYNHPWLRDLLIANIESVTDDLILFLQTKAYPLPAPMRQAVADAKLTHRTAKTDLEAEIAYLSSRETYYSNQLLLDIQHDSVSVETDSLRAWIRLQNNILFQQHIIDSYLQDGNLNQAKIENDKLALFALSSPSSIRQEILDFVALKKWMLVILQTPERISILGENDLTFLRNMASAGTGTARYQAQNILCFFYDECDPFYFEFDVDTRAAQSSNDQINSVPAQPQISIYPNPANDWVMVEISLADFEKLENVTIIILDVTGKEVFQTNLIRNTYLWETAQVQNGVYLITVKSNDGLFATQKIIVSK